MDNQIRIAFPFNGHVCLATITAALPAFAFASREEGGWEWRGVPSTRRLQLHAAYAETAAEYDLVPWAEVSTLNLQGATVVDAPIDFHVPAGAE